MYDLAELRDELAGSAEEVAEAFGVKLDYSPGSVKRVEKILGKIHVEYRKTRIDDGLHGVALEFAAYTINVIEQNYAPGVWVRDHPVLGEETFPYLWLEREIFPYAWCQKRILDGESDNVWSKFKTLVIQEAG